MKKFYTFLLLLITGTSFSQVEGTWYLAQQEAALAVGPGPGTGDWWFNNTADLTSRACLWDDSVVFSANGDFANGMDADTWLEPWQGMDPEGCGAPVAPHNDAMGSWNYDAGTGDLIITGVGAHMGLPKVLNGAELPAAGTDPGTRTYNVSFSPDMNTMTASINFGPGFWTFVYQKSGTTGGGPSTYDVTFNVDMNDYAGTIVTGVYINGNFNGWCGDCNPMINTGGGVWKTTLTLDPGTIQYKFTVDGWTDEETFVGGESCTVTDGGFTNRLLEVADNEVLPVVCFNSCEACPGGQGSESNVTFNVDMSQYADPIGTVYINGDFNGWCGDCNPLNDAGSGMWKGTFPLTVGAPIEYKYTIDAWTVAEEFVPGGTCTITDASGQFTNRYLMVEAGDPSLDIVCWESCDACVVGIEETTSSFSIAPNPFTSEIEISSSSSMKYIKVVDLSGKTVDYSIVNGKYAKLNLEHLISGVYTVMVETSDSISTSRIIKQ